MTCWPISFRNEEQDGSPTMSYAMTQNRILPMACNILKEGLIWGHYKHKKDGFIPVVRQHFHLHNCPGKSDHFNKFDKEQVLISYIFTGL